MNGPSCFEHDSRFAVIQKVGEFGRVVPTEREDDAQADATGGTPGPPGVPATDDGWEWWL